MHPGPPDPIVPGQWHIRLLPTRLPGRQSTNGGASTEVCQPWMMRTEYRKHKRRFPHWSTGAFGINTFPPRQGKEEGVPEIELAYRSGAIKV